MPSGHRLLASLALLGLLSASSLISQAADKPLTTPVTLAIHSDTGTALRCTIMLAHFVTQNADPNSHKIELTFDRDDASGTLAERRSGRAMQVENILCGDRDNWQATQADIPLALLRPPGARHFAAHCRLEPRLRCTVEALDS